MEQLEAINIRRSRRTYSMEPIAESKVNQINEVISQLNKEGNLNFQFVVNDSKAFDNMKKTYGFFKNVKNYIAIIGKNGEVTREKMGYYGEQVILEATGLGLGTCWVGATFDRLSCPCLVEEDETFYGVITIGNVEEKFSLKEKAIAKVARRKTKAIEEMYESDENVPQWFIEGMNAVQKAPSARNKQPVKFYYKKGHVTAEVSEKLEHGKVDLGIAKLHFEIGAGGGCWEFGNKGVFVKK